jgi:hypothetical protein
VNQATIVFANHRPETVAHAADLMRKHTAVLLEEPPDPCFRGMLEGDIAVEDYVMTLDTEYPEFSRAMSRALQKIHRQGIPIYQVEPYLEHLIRIHETFARGGSPRDLDKTAVEYSVYLAERQATAALLDFYKNAAVASFAKTLASVKRFARIDARRFVVRDRMRAEALASILQRHSNSYIEAGQIHYALWRLLHRKIGHAVALRPRFLMDRVVGSLGISRHLYAPGDVLTLYCIFHPDRRDPIEDVLAARALIYSKLIRKDEMAPRDGTYPHTRDELEVIEIVKKLTLEDCADLFAAIRRLKTDAARELVAHHLTATGRKTFRLQKSSS